MLSAVRVPAGLSLKRLRWPPPPAARLVPPAMSQSVVAGKLALGFDNFSCAL